MKILYIEDDLEIGSWVKEELENRGYQVEWLASGLLLNDEVPDFIILDIMLPGLDGFSLGKRLKRSFPDVPLLMLSARSALDDKLEGLELADDYMTKPFHMEELAKRVEVHLRRYDKVEQHIYHLQHLIINEKSKMIKRSDRKEEILLTGKQFQLFFYFTRHLQQILTKEQLFEAIWGYPYVEGDKTLMVHIRYLREKIEKNPSEPTIIETVRGIGYRMRK
ncbi:response regulator transcription factor [Alkalihalobacillus pseudalcaliphilus]|uniref:response regulator transcription factor n=1 Tax=Alkalihalobacillus pseudalcaliphilus TaxID=79884 RepID=UPI00064DC92D|nr:response regulator transcription factor [Alkalihalobacillus pseudalcaliphilus]KMK75490.1 chemotaxis protein CheY [Alkalihalobacillus pseudalcaliphilus]